MRESAEGFYSIESWAIFGHGFPYICRKAEGFKVIPGSTRYGHNCGAHIVTEKTIVSQLDPIKGTKWPDVIGCGHFPLFIVSGRVIDAWETEGIGTFPGGEITIVPHSESAWPKKLRGTNPPRYFWIDGEKLRGALVDFEASGFVGVHFCPDCGTRMDDGNATHDR